ncbi:MAG: MFS transporter [Acidobacteriia bacterium]|nr:MFS transporter [Terriglobia bacterium]
MQPSSTLKRPTRVRHIVLAMTVLVYAITYMDRTAIGSAVPSIQKEFGFSLVTTGWILASFRWAYALFQIPGGWLGDRIGPRRALTLIVTWWSAFTAFTALAWNATSMIAIRSVFGIGEAGAFPIATRSLSRWMLPSERGYAQGITHAGSRLGAALTPPLVVLLITTYGWRAPFVVFGALGLVWSVLWFVYYRDTPDEHHGVNPAELELIHSASGGPRQPVGAAVPWKRILTSSTLWAVCAMYFCYQYALAVYLDWFPTYLKDHRGFTLKQMGFYASLPLLAGVVGDLTGGWVSDVLLRRSGNVARSRRLVGMAGFLIAAAGIIPATLTGDPRTSVAFSCLAFGGLELTVGVSWAIPLDIAGDFAGSAAALMNSVGNIGAAISPALLAYLVTGYGWNVPFLVASGLCVVGMLIYTRIDAGRRIFDAPPSALSPAAVTARPAHQQAGS